MNHEIFATAKALVAEGKGILAADESTGTIAKRLSSINAENTEANRRDYRAMLFSSPGIGEHISGAILYDETIRQTSADGRRLVDILTENGIIPGIKVDKGATPMAGTDGETVTEGLDGLRERLADYYRLGARFTKWRAVIRIGNGQPTNNCLVANAHALGRFAALTQEASMVPIVEPEVLMDGPHHIARCGDVTEAALAALYDALYLQGVALEGTLLKPNMVIAGTDCPTQTGPEEIAAATLATLRRGVPAAVPGIVFLSGGQTEEQATANLNEMNKSAPHPWQLSFSYGRALQQSALKAWAGKAENVDAAQKAFLARASLNGAASLGTYPGERAA